jgi:hypothetical protein
MLSVVLIALAAGASGCASRRFDALMRSWEGRSVDELFRTWGPPNYLYSDGKGGQVAVYVPRPSAGRTRSGAESARLRAAAAARVYEAGMTNSWPIFRIFFSDPAGRVTRSEWRGRWECCSS